MRAGRGSVVGFPNVLDGAVSIRRRRVKVIMEKKKKQEKITMSTSLAVRVSFEFLTEIPSPVRGFHAITGVISDTSFYGNEHVGHNR